MLRGLDRITRQKGFSKCAASENELKQYKRESDSVEMYLDENDYKKSVNDYKPLKELYSEYQEYCKDAGNRYCGRNTFSQRLKDKGFDMIKVEIGKIVYIEKKCCF